MCGVTQIKLEYERMEPRFHRVFARLRSSVSRDQLKAIQDVGGMVVTPSHYCDVNAAGQLLDRYQRSLARLEEAVL
jgi:hypothetical protein